MRDRLDGSPDSGRRLFYSFGGLREEVHGKRELGRARPDPWKKGGVEAKAQ